MLFEIVCGLVSGAAVAPLVSVVDEAIFSNASGKATVMQSLKASFGKMLREPGAFVRSPTFLWIWAVYGSTYAVSNSIERVLLDGGTPKSEVATSPIKFLGTSGTNIGMSVLKDRAFTKMFGVTSPRPIPPLSLVCYGTRDAITILASFTLVEPVGQAIHRRFGMDEHYATLASQMFCPLLSQTINTPFFLYGMNLYNNPAASFAEHRQFIAREYTKTLACRLARIGPAFSIGGVLNRILRQQRGSPDQERVLLTE